MTTPWEVAANAVTAVAILLAGRNSVHTWWTGIVGCVLFAWVFLQSRLYADVVLQGFFIVTSAIGWWQWQRGWDGGPRRITRARVAVLAWAVPIGGVATLSYGAMLHALTDAYAPFIDSAVLVFSVIAQILLMQRKVESWAFWLLVNTIAVPLYASRGLYLTALLYAVYWVNAAIAIRHWSRLARNEALPTGAASAAV